MGCVYAALAGHGTIDSIPDARRLVAALAAPGDDCLVIDPALITPAIAESIAVNLAEFPRAVVAFSSVSTAALESAVILAQRTPARFIFRGTPNDRSALQRALLLTPDAELRAALLFRIDSHLNRLPPAFRDRLMTMFRTGDGPHSPDALSAATAFTRRTLDRYLADAGFVSARRLIEAAHITAGYRAITTSRIPLKSIASMLGYTASRTMDAQFMLLLDTTSGKLRARPLSFVEVAERLALRLTQREPRQERDISHTRAPAENGRPALTLINGRTRTRHARLRASGEPGTKP